MIPTNNQFTTAKVLRTKTQSLTIASFRLTVFSLSCLISIMGCGTEDFSEPPLAITNRLAKAQAEAKKQAPETMAASSSPADGDNLANGDQPEMSDKLAESVRQETNQHSSSSETTTSPLAAANQNSSTEESTFDLATGSPTPFLPSGSKPDLASASTGPTAGDRSNPAGNEISPSSVGPQPDMSTDIVTAGSRTKDEIDTQKTEETSSVGARASLLDKLTTGDDGLSPIKPKKVGREKNNTNKITRFGRYAIAPRAWFQLQNQLAKRFYVAATDSGSHIAASSGTRGLAFLRTHVETMAEESQVNRTSRRVPDQRRTQQTTSTESVRIQSGIISSIELSNQDDVVLVGTQDGRLVARSSLSRKTWDIYSQDLLTFQDKHRPSTQLAKVAITAIRTIDSGSLLTINAKHECHLWNKADVVHPLIEPQKLTYAAVESPETTVMNATPKFQVMIPTANVLNVSFSSDRSLGTVVTSDETVTVFSTEDGQIIDTITAQQLNDTQPVTAIVERNQKTILIGAADGRIFRRSLVTDQPLKSIDDQGLDVNYELIFSPDVKDRSGAITCLEVDSESGLLYIGRIDGSLSVFDVPRMQLMKTISLHKGPIIEARSTKAGVMTIGTDRIAKLSNWSPTISADAAAVQSFELPRDEVLSSEVFINDPDQPQVDPFNRSRNFHPQRLPTNENKISQVGIRPSDPVVALLHHRLRVAATEDIRDTIRTDIRLRDDSEIKFIQPDDTDSEATVPELVFQIPTSLDFDSKLLRPVIMGLSNDGRTLAAAQSGGQQLPRGKTYNHSVFAWDTPTGTPIRKWTELQGIRSLLVSADCSKILPTPLTAKLNLLTGEFLTDASQADTAWCLSTNSTMLATGIQGRSAISQSVIQIEDLSSHTTTQGLEAFEGYLSAIRFSHDSSKLFVNLRERSRFRLLELDATSLEVISELSSEPVNGNWDPENGENLNTIVGATEILVSPDGERLLTYGHYPDGWQFRIWKRKRGAWPADQVTIIPSKDEMVETEMTSTPFVFVNGESRELAVVTPSGFATIGLRKGRVEQSVPLPNIDGRRPVTLLTADGKLGIAGDQHGKVYLWKLRTLQGKPRFFTAHSGPIVGLACSSDGRFLATAGEENRINIWDLKTIDPDRYRSAETQGPSE